MVLVVLCVAVAAGYAGWAVSRGGGRRAGGPVSTGDPEAHRALNESGDMLMFQHVVAGEHWAQVGLVPVDSPHGPRIIAPLRCRRIHFAGGHGLCLADGVGLFAKYDVYVFGSDFRVLHKLSLNGIPSRARVSPDGRYGATTVFVAGHSYADAGFSTETLLHDLVTGRSLGNLEEFAVLRDGVRFKSVDFNFWGVTFTPDGGGFYATLATKGQTFLVRGDIATRRMHVLRRNVECPSLSPDGRRLAFKKNVGGGVGVPQWRFHVLDLATMEEVGLTETRSIDDQVEWLDNDHLLYAVAPDLWTVSADGRGVPRRFASNALSPAVVRAHVELASTAVRTVMLPSADVAVRIAATPDPARVGEDLLYTVTVTNRGPADATEVDIDVRLPDGVTFAALGRPDPPVSPHGCAVQGGYVSCTVEHLKSGESWTIPFTVKPTTGGRITNQVTVGGPQPDPQPANDSATVVTRVVARAER